MRWLARVFASAIARRLAYVLVAATLAWCGMGRAEAQALQCGSATEYSCDQGRASTACQTYDPTGLHPAGTFFGVTRRNCILIQENLTRGYYILNYWGKNANGVEEGVYRQGNFYFGKGCESRPDYNGAFPSVYGTPRNGSVNCFDGCQIAYYDNGDGTFNGKYTSVPAVCKPDDLDDDDGCKAKFGASYYYNAALGLCEPKPPEKCPEGQVKDAKGNCEPNKCPAGMVLGQDGTCTPEKNECPAGDVKAPSGECLPGDGKCATGEVRGPDGTCKKDGDGDGDPDEPGEGDKSQFSGGDSCDVPPSCSGDAIMCGQARIQWRIDCNTRRDVNISGGSCASMPVCAGKNCKAMEYSQLLLQWRTACAAEKTANSAGAGGGDGGDLKAIRDALTGNGTADIGADGKPADAFSDESGYGEDGYPTGELDTQGFGYSRTCPTIPDVAVFGKTLHFDTSKFCQWMVLGGQIVLVMASLVSLRLMSQGGT